VPHPHAPVSVGGVDLAARFASEPGQHAMVCPGGRLAWRCAGVNHFAVLCQALLDAGRTPWLAPGPGEETMCAKLRGHEPRAQLLPVTTLDQLAELMRAAGCTVCNNSGPMHLSVAVGSPTFALFVKMDAQRWGHPQPQHSMVVLGRDDPQALGPLRARFGQWLGGLRSGTC
jgi:ADP-heptose:LPS heptosyltransferase